VKTVSLKMENSMQYCPELDIHFSPKDLHYLHSPKDHKKIKDFLVKTAVSLCEEREVAVEVGAHVGLYTRDFAKEFREVVSFEATPETFSIFTHNTQDLVNVRRIHAAVGKSRGTCDMEILSDSNSGMNRVKEGTRVPLVTLDDYLFPKCDLLKLDVEGMEFDVLLGARNLLHTHYPVIILEDKGNSKHFGVEKGEVVAFLQTMGYKVEASSRSDYILKKI